MKSKLPRPIANLAKKVVIPYLRNKWKKHPIVADWVAKGYIDDREIDFIVLNWKINNAPVPPPHKVKQLIITDFGKKYNCKILVETGTFKGTMVEAQKKHFDKVYSIELSKEYWEKAKIRFKNDANVHLLNGDSGEVLPKFVPTLTEKSLFWLDGHYCGSSTALSAVECPIYAELDAIFDNNKEHIILIDDARLFVGKYDYPTMDELRTYVSKKAPSYHVLVEEDIIRVIPKT